MPRPTNAHDPRGDEFIWIAQLCLLKPSTARSMRYLERISGWTAGNRSEDFEMAITLPLQGRLMAFAMQLIRRNYSFSSAKMDRGHCSVLGISIASPPTPFTRVIPITGEMGDRPAYKCLIYIFLVHSMKQLQPYLWPFLDCFLEKVHQEQPQYPMWVWLATRANPL